MAGRVRQDSAPRSSLDSLEPEERAYQKILRLASVRERSTAQLRERLARDGFEPSDIDTALERAERNRVVDDARYAEFYVRSKLACGKGAAGILRELECLGIDPESVEPFQEHCLEGQDAEEERAMELLRRKPPRSKNKREGAFRKLMQQGYSAGVASSVARRWAEEQD